MTSIIDLLVLFFGLTGGDGNSSGGGHTRPDGEVLD